MKAVALKTFKDLKGKVIRKKGDIFEVTRKRFEEINSTSYGPLAEEIKEPKKEDKDGKGN